jgi:hypothetical protein
LHKLAEIVLAGAKRRSLKRTGRMQAAMAIEYGSDETGMYADITSPVKSIRNKVGYPYAFAHEGRHVVDRRPHRSLRPALRDIRKILSA